MTTEVPAAAPASAPQATPPGNPSPMEQMAATAQGDGLSLEQERDAYQFGIDRGIISPDRAKKEMAEKGNTLPLKLSDTPADAPAPDAGDPFTMPGFEPAKAHEFQFPDLSELNAITDAAKDGTPGRALTNTETMEMQKTWGGWMETAKLPAAIGSAIAKIAGEHIKAMPNFPQRPESERQAYKITEIGRLQALWGDKYAENLAHASGIGNALAEKHPEFLVFLGRTGLGDNAAFIAQMAMHGKRLAARWSK